MRKVSRFERWKQRVQRGSRTTKELIDELHCEVGQFSTVQLVVGFEDSSILISADDPNGLATLNDAMQRGGEPIGFVGSILEPQTDGQTVRLYHRPLDEYANEKWAKDFLDGILDGILKLKKGRIA